MPHIGDKDRSVFKEAYATTLDNFTGDEQVDITACAVRLQDILTAAKKRQQEGLTNR